MATSRADFIARYHLLELLPYLCLAGLLTDRFGAVGAAAASSARLAVPVFVFLPAARRFEGLKAAVLPGNRRDYLLSLAALLLPVAAGIIAGANALILIGTTVLAVIAYAFLVWTRVLTGNERNMVGRLFTLH
jgi:hypothetical protein